MNNNNDKSKIELLNANNWLTYFEENKEKVNKYAKKHIYTTFDIYFEELYNNGILFFGFTLLEDLINEDITPELIMKLNNKKNLNKTLKNINTWIAHTIQLSEMSYISIEKHKNGLPHYHGIIAIRSLIGKNNKIALELKKFLFKLFKDVKVDYLESFNDVKKFFNYVIKEHEYENHYLTFYTENSNEYSYYYDARAALFDHLLELSLDEQINQLFYKSRTQNIKGFGNDNLTNPRNKIIYLLNIYFNMNNLIVYNDKIFKKQENSKYTWVFYNKLDFIKNNSQEICSFLKQNFPIHLNQIDLFSLIISDLGNTFDLIKKTPNILPNNSIDYNVIEFKDGLYLLDQNYFFNFYKHKDKTPNIRCYKYFDCYYTQLEKPNLWLSLLQKNSQFNTEEELNEFCANLGRYFHTSSIIDFKQKTIYLVGASNTGKSTLITNILIEARGLENIGNINKSKEFAFEETENKLTILCDEFKYHDSLREDLLKLINFEPLSINKKNKAHTGLIINKAPVLFISNQIEQKMIEDIAFTNRLIQYTFDYVVTHVDINLKDKLKQELPSIMIFCNKKYFEYNFKQKNSKSEQKSHLRTRISKEIKQYLLLSKENK